MAQYSERDTVETDDGTGVILEVHTSNFEWKLGDSDDDKHKVEASKSDPVYVVALGSKRETKPIEESELSEGSFDEDKDADPKKLANDAEASPIYDEIDPYDPAAFRNLEELVNVPAADDPGVGFSSLPNGWNRATVLRAWASLGGSFSSCRTEMTGEVRSPSKFCAAFKDEVWGTEYWR